jgi:hypothetical protein
MNTERDRLSSLASTPGPSTWGTTGKYVAEWCTKVRTERDVKEWSAHDQTDKLLSQGGT